MPFALTMRKPAMSRRDKTTRVSAVASGSYTPGGDPIDFSNIADPNFYGLNNLGSVPTVYEVIVESFPAGYTAQIIANPAAPATPTLANALAVQIFSGTAQLAAGAYPAAITGGIIVFSARGNTFNE